MDFLNFKHYWIFFVTLIFYCIGFIVHFIAQYSGTHARNEKEILREASTNTKLVHNTFSNTTSMTTTPVDVDSPASDYASPSNLFYFAQISDIHISYDFTKGAQGHLYYFLKRIIPVVEPQFLFITGDITNSKKNGGYTVGTDEEEWKLYHKILEQTGVLLKNNGTFLWDLRGNHDCFMIPEWSSPFNFFKNYSKTGTRGFSFHYETSFGTYSFIGLDGCPVFTAANPFFGVIDEVTMDAYSEFMDHAKANPKNRHNFVFIHYPETTVKFGKSSSGKCWEDYTKDISLLLTGHFHSLVGDQIYAYHKNYLELELSDLKIHGKYRLVSIDHDIVSFSDYTLPLPELPFDFKTSNLDDIIHQPPLIFNQALPPIVLITSPKNSRFILETNDEPVKESLSSEYIRVLVFSSVSPSDLKLSLFINNKEQQDVTFKFIGESNQEGKSKEKEEKREEKKKRSWNKLVNIYSRTENTFNKTTTSTNTTLIEKNQTLVESNKIPPLWIAKWNPTTILNPNKPYELKVVALDHKNNLRGNHSITFRFDGQKEVLNTPLRSQLLLKSVFVKLLPILFGIVYISYEVIILLSRFYAIRYIIPKHSNLPFLPNRYVGDLIYTETKSFHQTFFKKHFILSFIEAFTLNGIFYPLQILVLCLLVFPSKVGLMSRSSEHFSRLCGEFLYGFYGSGQWSNTFDQYGTFMVIFILVPYLNTFLIVFTNHRRHRNSILTFILLILMGGIQLVVSISSSYKRGGILTLLLSPFPIWICLYSWILIILIIIRRFKDNKSTTTTELA